MRIELIDKMGGDILVANAARVSLDKHHEYFDASDERLLNYLAKHRHWSPFAHPHICTRVTVPIFVARQLFKHKVGFIENEISRRYVDSDPEFYITDKFGIKSENKKQGAKEGEFITHIGSFSVEEFLENKWKRDLQDYHTLLEHGIAAEDARVVLPFGTYTSYYLTGSLFSYFRMYSLRISADAQRQTQDIAKQIDEILSPLFPFSWTALKEHYNG